MPDYTINLSTRTLTQTLDLFRERLAAEAQRVAQEDGIALRQEVLAQVLTTLDVLATATHAQGA